MIRRAFPVAIGALLAFGLPVAASGRRSSSTRQGQYQGKPNQKAYDTAPWNGNKRDWEVALATRNQNQNEYKRIR